LALCWRCQDKLFPPNSVSVAARSVLTAFMFMVVIGLLAVADRRVAFGGSIRPTPCDTEQSKRQPRNMNFNRREFLLAIAVRARTERDLLSRWQAIARNADGTVGIAALHLGTDKLVTMNGEERFPLASVMKVPLAMHILALVDDARLSLDQDVEVLPRDVFSGVSEIAKLWSNQKKFRVGEMLELMVARSDNTAEETLFRIGGGGSGITARLRRWKIDGVRVDRSERQCGLDMNGVEHYPPPEQWTDTGISRLIDAVPTAMRYKTTLKFLKDPRDTATPKGTVAMFARLFRGEFLSRKSSAYLIDILKSTATFPTRLKGALPPGTVVAHKTGSHQNISTFTAATNDSGVIFLPNNGQLAMSVYIKASTRNDAARDDVIAQAARAAFEEFKAG
jgi:beta-lactamase class A